jgi:hypothetical protein
MRHSRTNWRGLPRPLLRPATRMDNLAIVPASELASLARWQQDARQLPAGDTLLVVRAHSPHLHRISHGLAEEMRRQGHQVVVRTLAPSPREV